MLAGHEFKMALVHEDRRRLSRGRWRHRVRHAFERHLRARRHDRRNAERQRFRTHLDRSQSLELLLPPRFRNHLRRAAHRLVIDLVVPRRELRLEIGFIKKFPGLEERSLHPSDEPLDRALLVSASRRAHLDAHADVDDRLREGRVELLDLAAYAGLRDDGARTIEHGHQRQPAERDEVPREATHDGLDALVLDDRHSDESRVFQAGSEEVNASSAPVEKAHVDLTEVVLRELSGQAFEANDGRRVARSVRGNERVEGGLAARVAVDLGATKELLRRQRRLIAEPTLNDLCEGRGLRRASDASRRGFVVIVHVRDLALPPHASNGVDRGLAALCDVGHREARVEQDLDLVSLEQRDHPLLVAFLCARRAHEDPEHRKHHHPVHSALSFR